MKKKELGSLMIAALFLAILLLSANAWAQTTITWKGQSFVPAGTIYHEWAVDWAKKITNSSGGRLKVTMHSAGEIVPTMETFDAVKNGVLDVGYTYSAMWMGRMEESPFFTAVPGGFGVLDNIMWMYKGGGIELWQELYDKHNIKVQPGGIIGMEIFMWTNKPVNKIEDFKGLKLRAMPYWGDILKEKGYSVVFIPAGEIIPAMERGVLDAAEYSIPAFDLTLGFPDVAKYYIYPGLHQPSSVLEVLINKNSFNKLPADLKEMVSNVCKAGVVETYTWGEAANVKALEKFEKMGKKRIVLSKEVQDTLLKWCDEYMDKKATKNPTFAKILKSQRDFKGWWQPYKKFTTMEER
jgi:TRAP-type mannitol/chloroaromatic compound transport system substrate-binding protein